MVVPAPCCRPSTDRALRRRCLEHPLATHATGEVVGELLEKLPGPPDLAVLFVTGPLLPVLRRPGLAGLIGWDALSSPDSLIIIVGHVVADLSQTTGARPITQISTTSPDSCATICAPTVGTNSNGRDAGLVGGGRRATVPGSRLHRRGRPGCRPRDESNALRLMRLVGATPRQIARLATVESSVATVVGVVAALVSFPDAPPG